MDTRKNENSVVELVKEKTVSLSKTFYISFCWLVVACLSSITLEVGARSPLGYSVTKSAAFNKIFRRNYSMKIYIETGNLLSSILSTGLITMARQTNNPYLYIPWLINTMCGMLINEAPAFFNFINTQIPYAPLPALIFAFTSIILFVEEICIWCNALENFMIDWKKYVNKNHSHIEVELHNVENKNNHVKSDDDDMIHDNFDEHKISSNSKRAKSLTSVINYSKKNL